MQNAVLDTIQLNEEEHGEDDEEKEEKEKIFFMVTLVCLMLFYAIIGSILSQLKLKVGHSSTITTLVGFIISVIIYASRNDELEEIWTFNADFFFIVLLPLVIFNKGFSMR